MSYLITKSNNEKVYGILQIIPVNNIKTKSKQTLTSTWNTKWKHKERKLALSSLKEGITMLERTWQLLQYYSRKAVKQNLEGYTNNSKKSTSE